MIYAKVQGFPQSLRLGCVKGNYINVRHRAAFYHILRIQKGTAEYLIDFELVKAEINSFLSLPFPGF